jgi:hypothetical protein
MMKDLKKDDYGNSDTANAPVDIKLANRDTEIMIGEDNNHDDVPKADPKAKAENTVDKDATDMQMIEKQADVNPD